MNILDLFSGIGGFSLGLERAGMKTVAFCEVDKKAQLVLKKHWPDVPIFDDVSNLKGEHIEQTIDIICGGFPCQDISLAGKGAGLEGKRSGLWTEFHRLIKEIRPKYAIIENVSALRSRGLDQVLRSLSEIGYDAEWHCITAASVGAPHRRDRIWIVAYPGHRGGRDSITGSLGRDGERELEERIRTTETIETTGSSQTSESVAYANDSGSGTSRNGNNTKRPETIEGWEEQSLNRSGGSSENMANANTGLCDGTEEEIQSRWKALNSSSAGRGVEELNRSGKSSANVSNANNERLEGREWNGQRERREVLSSERQDRSEMGSEAGRIDRVSIQDNVSNTNGIRSSRSGETGIRENLGKAWSQFTGGSSIGYSWEMANANDEGLQRDVGQGEARTQGESERHTSERSWWAVEPDVGRVAHGVPNRVDRLKQLGNAVVPQIPQLIGMAIMEREKCLHG
jgi:DNA-cytosine methyltransferase